MRVLSSRAENISHSFQATIFAHFSRESYFSILEGDCRNNKIKQEAV